MHIKYQYSNVNGLINSFEPTFLTINISKQKASVELTSKVTRNGKGKKDYHKRLDMCPICM